MSNELVLFLRVCLRPSPAQPAVFWWLPIGKQCVKHRVPWLRTQLFVAVLCCHRYSTDKCPVSLRRERTLRLSCSFFFHELRNLRSTPVCLTVFLIHPMADGLGINVLVPSLSAPVVLGNVMPYYRSRSMPKTRHATPVWIQSRPAFRSVVD